MNNLILQKCLIFVIDLNLLNKSNPTNFFCYHVKPPNYNIPSHLRHLLNKYPKI